ncbi:uncharacterized protein K441DRAFT_718472, partial [Cenococcum geophilum 1.58]|uniref:uncharacterized protein n=1 Tax=Cenococcum geophilum 1.58 TaxID=794803 RepID=UPI00358F5A5A
MGRIIRSRKSRARHFTPPPEMLHLQPLSHPKTPSRCGVLWCKVIQQKLGIQIPKDFVREITGIPERTQSEILRSKQARTLHNQEDAGPDPRGRKPYVTRKDTAAIGAYLDDPTVSIDEKGKPWQDIAESASVTLPNTPHFKPRGYRTVEARAIREACKRDEDLITAVCAEEKELSPRQAKERLNWVDIQLDTRPHSKDFEDVVFSDEFHFGIGPQTTKKIKRRRGRKYRYTPENVHRKHVTTKDEKEKAREENHLKLLNVFVAIGYNYRR